MQTTPSRPHGDARAHAARSDWRHHRPPSRGRGVITLRAGAGAFQFSGDQADEVAPGRWRLHIVRTALLSVSPAKGHCDLEMRSAPPTYVSLSCRVLIGGDTRPVTVEWRGDGSTVERVR